MLGQGRVDRVGLPHRSWVLPAVLEEDLQEDPAKHPPVSGCLMDVSWMSHAAEKTAVMRVEMVCEQ